MMENGMHIVTVHKSELLKALKDNRETHKAAYLEAEKGYREGVIRELEKALDLAKSGKELQTSVFLPKPEDHTRDYDRVIRMLDMCVKDEIQVTEQEFSHYVLDDWQWKQDFVKTASTYAGRPR